MHDLTTALLIHGGLLVGYGSPLITYFILRRKALRSAAGRPTIQLPWWKSVCKFLSIGLFTGAIVWIVTIAVLFANLVSSMNEICPSLVTPDECSRATLQWQATCIGLIECACAAISIILWTVYAESNRTESPPERAYPLVLITISHCLLVASWDMCTPLIFSLKAFGIIGTKYWIAVSSTFVFISILAYIIGTTLWIIALIRVFCAWRCRSRSETPAEEQWPGESERDVVLQEI